MKNPERISKQISFILEIEELKQVFRQSLLIKDRRQENDAEHSWHLAVMAMVLSEYSNEPINLMQVMKMLLVHDIIEIDAGDTFCYDQDERKNQQKKEREAAERIFALLPIDQASVFQSLWEEFEQSNTPEACFTRAIDRVEPILLNFHTQGEAWRKFGITKSQVIDRNKPIEKGSKVLWEYVSDLIDQAAKLGYLINDS